MKKKIAALSAVALSLSLAGCTMTTPISVGTIGDVEIPAGVYLLHQYNAYQNAKSLTTEEDVLKATLTLEDGTEQSGADYVETETLKSLEYYADAETKYKELGGELSQEEIDFATSQTESMWENYSEVMEANGIGKASIQIYMEGAVKVTQLVDMICGPEGTDPVSDEELESYVNENFRQGQYIALPLMDYTTYTYLDDDTKAQMQQIADKMKAALEEGQDMTEVAKTYLPEALPLAGEEYSEEELNNYMSSLSYTPGSADNFGEEVSQGILDTGAGQVSVIESGAMLMVYQGQNIWDTYSLDEVRDTALVEMKGDELDTMYAEEGAALPHNLDEKAMKTYSPKNIR